MHEAIGGFGLYLWQTDIAIRLGYIIVLSNVRTAKIEALPADVIRITFNKD